MLTFFPAEARDGDSAAIWLDLNRASAEETDQAEKLMGFALPTREQLSEIESSSRLQSRAGALFMNTPVPAIGPDGDVHLEPLGFVLSRDRLLTIRFCDLKSFDAVGQGIGADGGPKSGPEVFVELCEEIVDRLADSLEQTAAELQGISQKIFHVPEQEGPKSVQTSRAIRHGLQQLGQIGDRLSDTRSVLLGIGRVVDFARELSADWCGAKAGQRLKTLRQDVASLADYEPHLTDKVQFLLDAMVGLIGMAQNDIFKILTIVSIVGIPPTLMAGVYGMNFKYMPELGWAYGYPLGLAVIVLSGVIPLAWFKWRGWF